MAVAEAATLERIPTGLLERRQRSLWTDAFERLRRNRMALFALFVIIFMAAFGPSLGNIFIAIALTNWVGMARLTRGQLLSLKEKEFVEAARCLGVPAWKILFRHLLPNALGPIIVSVTFGIPGAIFIEAALSFIGLGVQPPTATWGGMVNLGYQAIFSDAGLVIFPALAIAITMMAFTFLGDGLRDAIDPRGSR